MAPSMRWRRRWSSATAIWRWEFYRWARRNDFATSVGIPQELASALKLAIVGRDVAIDIARVNDKTGFINMATGGFGTRITTETPEKLKAALGGVSYLIHGLMRMDALKRTAAKSAARTFTGTAMRWSSASATDARPEAASSCARKR
ncbi:transcription regulator [Klebsiella grimontii]|uniref:Transcription regulator n=1 Tax=Klebsiella grimontii TaxID=2058152 RepID=A0A7H4P0A0_9ENTR|nr:transcription regulator [Klebsiella grimontii]